MRASQWLLGLATTGTVLGAIAAGCGGSSSSGGGTDSGAADVTSEAIEAAAPEAAAEASKEAGLDAASEACVPVDADLTTFPIPDSGLPDAGIDLASCVACLRSNCNSELEACNADCVCIDTIAGCLNGGAISVSCVGAAALTDTALQGLGLCVESACTTQCTPPKAEGGSGEGGGNGEGGGGEGGDAAGD